MVSCVRESQFATRCGRSTNVVWVSMRADDLCDGNGIDARRIQVVQQRTCRVLKVLSRPCINNYAVVPNC